jgi:hypothetical protein
MRRRHADHDGIRLGSGSGMTTTISFITTAAARTSTKVTTAAPHR